MVPASKRVVKRAEVRQDEILDAAQRLFMIHGYDDTPIQAIIDAVGIAKGTFYHHYASKPALLDALVARTVAQSIEVVQPIVADPTLRGVDKLNAVFLRVGAWKSDHRALLTEMHRALNAEANAPLLAKVQRRSTDAIAPIVAEVIAQGVAEGDFDTPFPAEAAEIVLALGVILGRSIGDALLADEVKAPDVVAIRRGLEAYHDGVTRVLGAKPGSIHLVDIDSVMVWFTSAVRA